MTESGTGPRRRDDIPAEEMDEKSDWKVVLRFFVVPLSLVAVLVSVFFGLQVLRSSRPDPAARLGDLTRSGGFFLPWAGDPKRWQSGYDLSLLLRTPDGGSRQGLIPGMTAAFRDAGRSHDLKLRHYLALAIGRAADPGGIAALREGLSDSDGETRLYCAWSLMQIGGGEALPALRQAAASDGDAGVRKMAVFALGQLGDHAAAGTLGAALRDSDRDVRWNAALALARIGDDTGESTLVEMLETPAGAGAAPGSPDDAPALNAVRGLALLHDDRARRALEKAAAGGGDAVGAEARRALEALGSEACKTLP